MSVGDDGGQPAVTKGGGHVQTIFDAGPEKVAEAEPLTVPVFARSVWNALPPIVERMKANPSDIRHITIHHTAGINRPGMNEPSVIHGIQNFHRQEKKWGDLAYHYFVSPSGRIYEGRDAQYVPDTATEYDTTGHITVCLLGNFEREHPSDAAKNSLIVLVAALLQAHKLSPSAIRVHRQVARTACPGQNLIHWLETEGNSIVSKKTDQYKFIISMNNIHP